MDKGSKRCVLANFYFCKGFSFYLRFNVINFSDMPFYSEFGIDILLHCSVGHKTSNKPSNLILSTTPIFVSDSKR